MFVADKRTLYTYVCVCVCIFCSTSISFIIYIHIHEKAKDKLYGNIHVCVRHSLTFSLNRRHPCLHVLTQLAFKLVAHPTELHDAARVRGQARGNMRLIKKVSVYTAVDCNRENIHTYIYIHTRLNTIHREMH